MLDARCVLYYEYDTKNRIDGISMYIVYALHYIPWRSPPILKIAVARRPFLSG